MSVSIEGGCLCGAIRYRATARPVSRSICHCRTCRRASGAPSVAWSTFHIDHFAFTSGTPTQFYSSPDVVRTFCGRCGTPLGYRNVADPGTLDITTATLDAPEDYPPTKEIWIDHRLEWEPLSTATHHYPQDSGS